MTTKTLTLTDFLLARITAEEELAHDAASEGTPSRTGWQLWTSKVSTTPGGERLGPRGSIEASPARVLADLDAKRRIVAEHDGSRQTGCTVCYDLGVVGLGPMAWPCSTLRFLGLPYAGHPDYREEWRA